MDQHDVFISHASEDKPFARSLAQALEARGRSVWLDEQEMVPGDSLQEKLSEGLARARLGAVLLSRAFFRKRWTVWELSGLTARQMGGEGNVIVPVWHGVSVDEVRRFSPPLADRLAINSAEGVDRVAEGILRTLRRVAPEDVDLPTYANLLDLLEIRSLEPSEIRERWKSAATGLRVVLGMGRRGPLAMDLLKNGPNTVVIGQVGAGKTELLRASIVSLALAHHPRNLRLVLIDYKGGTGLRDFDALPHEVSIVTDLDSASVREGVLSSLRTDFDTRARAQRAGSVPPAHDRQAHTLVVIDEFAMLAAEYPEFVDAVTDTAQQGRGLGIATVLTSQGNAVPRTIWANAGIRVAFRVLDPELSELAIGTPDAALLRRGAGRGYVGNGWEPPESFQGAFCAPATLDQLIKAMAAAAN